MAISGLFSRFAATNIGKNMTARFGSSATTTKTSASRAERRAEKLAARKEARKAAVAARPARGSVIRNEVVYPPQNRVQLQKVEEVDPMRTKLDKITEKAREERLSKSEWQQIRESFQENTNDPVFQNVIENQENIRIIGSVF